MSRGRGSEFHAPVARPWCMAPELCPSKRRVLQAWVALSARKTRGRSRRWIRRWWTAVMVGAPALSHGRPPRHAGTGCRLPACCGAWSARTAVAKPYPAPASDSGRSGRHAPGHIERRTPPSGVTAARGRCRGRRSAFVIARGHGPGLLQLVDGPLDGVGLLVPVLVEAGWPSAARALAQAAARLSLFSWMMCRMPRLCRYWRHDPLPYALSAATVRLLARPARPGPRSTDLLQHRLQLGAIGPLTGVMTRENGRQRPSALRWSLVVEPPRDRPHTP